MAITANKNTVAKKSQTKKIEVKELTCVMCGSTKKASDFNQSFNPIHQTGKLPYCKECLKNMCLDNKGNIEIENVKKMLKLIDRPFRYEDFKSACEDKNDTVGTYLKNIALNYRRDGWKDSVFEPQFNDNNMDNDTIFSKIDDFLVTNEIYEKWNFGYKPEEYYYFEKKYNQLKNNYPEKTAMHTEALLNYIRYRVKEELSTAKGDVKDAKEWGSLAKEAATAAKINPSQLSAADLTDGLTGFGQLSRAVEQAVDIIGILPKFKEKPQDKVDFTLLCYINYVRRLKGLEDCEYKEIYEFYNQKKKDFENRIIEEEIENEGDENGIS